VLKKEMKALAQKYVSLKYQKVKPSNLVYKGVQSMSDYQSEISFPLPHHRCHFYGNSQKHAMR
jgi:hypothetical protein